MQPPLRKQGQSKVLVSDVLDQTRKQWERKAMELFDFDSRDPYVVDDNGVIISNTEVPQILCIEAERTKRLASLSLTYNIIADSKIHHFWPTEAHTYFSIGDPEATGPVSKVMKIIIEDGSQIPNSPFQIDDGLTVVQTDNMFTHTFINWSQFTTVVVVNQATNNIQTLGCKGGCAIITCKSLALA